MTRETTRTSRPSATWPPRPDRAPSLAVASAVLRAVMVVQIVLGLIALPVAGFFVIGDLSDRTEEWDGLIAFLGVLAGGVALVLIGVGVLVLRLLRRNPFAAGVIASVLGGLVLLQGVHQGAAFGLAGLDVGAILVGLALAAPGAAVAWAARAR